MTINNLLNETLQQHYELLVEMQKEEHKIRKLKDKALVVILQEILKNK